MRPTSACSRTTSATASSSTWRRWRYERPSIPFPRHIRRSIGPAEVAMRLTRQAEADPDGFWLDLARTARLGPLPDARPATGRSTRMISISDWYRRRPAEPQSVNCLDRQLDARGDKTAIIFEARRAGRGPRPHLPQLYEETCRFANLLKSYGIGRGDRVMIYMPMIPEAAAAMLACARIGAVHSVCFGGFSPESLAGRIADCDACAVITADEGVRGGKRIPLEGQCRRGAGHVRRRYRHRRHPHRRRRADEGRAATSSTRPSARRSPPTASPR